VIAQKDEGLHRGGNPPPRSNYRAIGRRRQGKEPEWIRKPGRPVSSQGPGQGEQGRSPPAGRRRDRRMKQGLEESHVGHARQGLGRPPPRSTGIKKSISHRCRCASVRWSSGSRKPRPSAPTNQQKHEPAPAPWYRWLVDDTPPPDPQGRRLQELECSLGPAEPFSPSSTRSTTTPTSPSTRSAPLPGLESRLHPTQLPLRRHRLPREW